LAGRFFVETSGATNLPRNAYETSAGRIAEIESGFQPKAVIRFIRFLFFASVNYLIVITAEIKE
jgi:hypothetical protein